MGLLVKGSHLLAARQKYHQWRAQNKFEKMVQSVQAGTTVLPPACYAPEHIQTDDLKGMPAATSARLLAERAVNYHTFVNHKEKTSLPVRCLPWSCDVHGHMSHSNCFELFEISRRYGQFYTGLSRVARSRNLFLIVSANSTHFLEPVPIGAKVQLCAEFVAGDAEPDDPKRMGMYYVHQEMWSADFTTLHAVGVFDMVFLGPAAYAEELDRKYELDKTSSRTKKEAPTTNNKTAKINAYAFFADACGLQIGTVKHILSENRRKLSSFDELESATNLWRGVVRNRSLLSP